MACYRQAFVPPQPLIQLHRRFTTACSGLRLSVETGSQGWMAQVRDSQEGPTLYSAQRCSLSAAKVAAAKFAAFRTAGGMVSGTPESMALRLPWLESW